MPLRDKKLSEYRAYATIDGLLIDQNGIDHAAHLDELLPIPAVASEARDLAGANRTNLTEANLRYQPLKASALYPAGG